MHSPSDIFLPLTTNDFLVSESPVRLLLNYKLDPLLPSLLSSFPNSLSSSLSISLSSLSISSTCSLWESFFCRFSLTLIGKSRFCYFIILIRFFRSSWLSFRKFNYFFTGIVYWSWGMSLWISFPLMGFCLLYYFLPLLLLQLSSLCFLTCDGLIFPFSSWSIVWGLMRLKNNLEVKPWFSSPGLEVTLDSWRFLKSKVLEPAVSENLYSLWL